MVKHRKMKSGKHTFKAFRVEEVEGNFNCSIKDIELNPLKDNEILVRVYYSSLNYKDALSATGNKGVTKTYPHTPGIDAVGVVQESNSNKFIPGDPVIVTSYDLGMNTDGGFAEYIQVPADWAVRLPEGLSMKEAMIYGTAGLTAGISILRLAELVKPNDGKIVVSGATGGVGTLTISILSNIGYSVSAITGKQSEKDFLIQLGANEILPRIEIENFDKKPLLRPMFAGAVDTVGGTILENIIKSTQPMGVVTCCGNVASPKLELTVFPFILRGISLIGIDSQSYPMKYREIVWNKLANEWKPENLHSLYKEIKLDDLQLHINLMLNGKLKGRVVVSLVD